MERILNTAQTPPVPGGLAGRLLGWLRAGRTKAQPRLTLLERIALAPRQSLALVEAEGRRLLVATAPDSSPTIYALDDAGHVIKGGRRPRPRETQRRVSW
ncbi:MAG TPA: flagellar biosynthetic protein FliO [Terracidiphilus sp.]|nr:flagellar biosynthetic protein FliO [Terracidiphilus sp.]